MKELREIHKGLKELKMEKEEKQRLIESLRNEKGKLEEKNREILDKLNEAAASYGEAGKRLTEFVREQIQPIKKKLDGFDENLSEVRYKQKALMDAMSRISDFENLVAVVKAGLLKNEKAMSRIESQVTQLEKQDSSLMKRLVSLESEKSDEQSVMEMVQELRKETGDRMEAFGAVTNEIRKSFHGDLGRLKEDFEKMVTLLRKDSERRDVEQDKMIDSMVQNAERAFDEKFREITEGFEKRTEELEKRVSKTSLNFSKVVEALKEKVDKHKNLTEREMTAISKEVEDRLNRHMGAFAGGFDQKMKGVNSELEHLKRDLSNVSDVLDRKIEKGEMKRSKDMEKVVSEFMNIKGKAESDLDVIEKEIDRFSSKGERIKQDIIKASAKEMERISKENDAKLAGFKSMVEKSIDDFSKYMEKVKLLNEKQIDKLNDSNEEVLRKRVSEVTKDFEGRFSMVEGMLEGFRKEIGTEKAKMDKMVKSASEEINSAVKKDFRDLSNDLDGKIKRVYGDLERLKDGLSGAKGIEQKDLKGMKSELERQRKAIDSEMRSVVEGFEKDLRKNMGVYADEFNEKLKRFNDHIENTKEGLDEVRRSAEEEIKTLMLKMEKHRNLSEKELSSVAKSVEERIGKNMVKQSEGFDKRLNDVHREMEMMRKELSGAEGVEQKDLKEMRSEFERQRKAVESQMGSAVKDFGENLRKITAEQSEKLEERVRGVSKEMEMVRKDMNGMGNLLERRIEKGEVKREKRMERLAGEIMDMKAEVSGKTKEMGSQIEKMQKIRADISNEMNDLSQMAKRDIDKRVEGMMADFEKRMMKMEQKQEEKLKDIHNKVSNVKSQTKSLKEDEETIERLLKKVE